MRGALGAQRQSLFTRKCGFGWPAGEDDAEKPRPVPPDKNTIQGFSWPVFGKNFFEGRANGLDPASTLED